MNNSCRLTSILAIFCIASLLPLATAHAQQRLTLKASFAPMLHEGSGEQKFVTTPRYDLGGVLNPQSAQIVWQYLASPPELDGHSHLKMEGFIPWIGYAGDTSDLGRLKRSLNDLMVNGLPKIRGGQREVNVLHQYGAAFGGFCAKDVMGSREFAAEVRDLQYWNDRHLAWVQRKDPERKRLHEWNQIAHFLLDMHRHGNMHEECLDVYNDVRLRMCFTPESEAILIANYIDVEPVSVLGKILSGAYMKNPPKVTPELIRELEADFDQHYEPKLKDYLEAQFKKVQQESP